LVIVVADSSPVNYLVLVGQIAILPDLFGQVVVPRAVSSELRSQKAPEEVRRWMMSPPRWLRVETVDADNLARIAEPHLHLGEREAIALAQILKADYLIIDERAGRRAAKDRHLSVVGTIGVLEKADSEGLVSDFPGVIVRLRSTSFYLSPHLEDALLRRHRERRAR
jgi:predicted nucleic acid-binding protein